MAAVTLAVAAFQACDVAHQRGIDSVSFGADRLRPALPGEGYAGQSVCARAGEVGESEPHLLLDRCVGGQITSCYSIRRFCLRVTEAHQRRDNFLGLDARYADARRRRELVAQVEHDAGGELLAYTGSASERGCIAGSDGIRELVCFQDRKKGERDLWADAVHRDDGLEEPLLLDVGEAVQRHRVLANDETCVESDLGTVLRPRDYTGRSEDEVADAVHIDDKRVGVAAGDFAADAGDHIGNGKWAIRTGERVAFKAASPS